ncbi:MAG: PBP1A family penicillin-binding protein, partial [Ignavibacteriae bacterium]|nr:PBP1A family penicillin-binding protein [Ignavibacteriota bacterium]
MTPKKLLLLLFGVLTSAVLILVLYSIGVVYGNVPSFEQLENPKQDLATQVVSSDGEILDHFFIKRRTYIPFDSIPAGFINSLISTEDREFYNHWGIHSARIFKAVLVKSIFYGKKEGGSTITQQLARNLFYTQEKSIRRKILEAVTAVKIEQTYTKKEILELYANTVYFGRGAYGIQIAAQVYFNKTALELSQSECAYLVALLKGPDIYNAEQHYEKALARRNLVLHLTFENKLLGAGAYNKSIDEPITLPTAKTAAGLSGIAPHFVEMVRQKLEKDERYGMKNYNLYRDGLVIYTTLNAKIQRHANAAVDEHLREFQKQFLQAWTWKDKSAMITALVRQAIRERPDYIAAKDDDAKRSELAQKYQKNQKFIDSVKRRSTLIQTGLVVMDPSTGFINALVGASPEAMKYNSESRYSLNHITQIRRQPGSSFKPFVYASALENGLTPVSEIESGPYSYTLPSGQIWSPSGTGSSGGLVTLSYGLKLSINTVAARLITQHTTPSEVILLAKKMGITTPMDPFPTIALGAEEVIPIDIVSAYGAFANQGISVEPVCITKIEDRFGTVLYEYKNNAKITDAISPKIAQQMTSMMQGVVNGGTASGIRKWFKYDAAGKTGTTNDFTDAWFVGFTPQLVAGVWVGFDNQRVKFTGWYGQGGKAAAPIWGRLMAKIYSDPKLDFRKTRFGFPASPSDPVAPRPRRCALSP